MLEVPCSYSLMTTSLCLLNPRWKNGPELLLACWRYPAPWSRSGWWTDWLNTPWYRWIHQLKHTKQRCICSYRTGTLRGRSCRRRHWCHPSGPSFWAKMAKLAVFNRDIFPLTTFLKNRLQVYQGFKTDPVLIPIRGDLRAVSINPSRMPVG